LTFIKIEIKIENMGKIVLSIFFILSIFSFSEVRKNEYKLIYSEWKKIFSDNKEEVAEGIYKIGDKKIESCIPVILILLNDNSIVWLKCNGYGKWTKIGWEVEEAMIKIGKNSLKYISNLLLKNEYPYIKIDENGEKRLIEIISKITGESFENIEDCKNYLKDKF
jgi:hypothetical protein